MRTSMAYFAGAGTVIAAIGLGLGGGLTIANVISPHREKLEQTKLEQRMSAKPIPPSAQADQANIQAAATDQPRPEQDKPAVPQVAATNAATSANAPAPTPSQPQPRTQAAAPAPQSSPSPAPQQASIAKDQAKDQTAKDQTAKDQTAKDRPAKSVEPQTAKSQSAPREQAASSADDSNAKARSPEDANAKARDSDLKRLAAEKRKAERRQQWADRKKAQQQRDAELRDVEANVRRDTDGPRIRDSDGPRIVVRQDDDDVDRRGGRHDFDRRGPDRPFGFPGFNLFGGDRDD
jgi:hypothetical protein